MCPTVVIYKIYVHYETPPFFEKKRKVLGDGTHNNILSYFNFICL